MHANISQLVLCALERTAGKLPCQSEIVMPVASNVANAIQLFVKNIFSVGV
jgi:hypothetical protein